MLMGMFQQQQQEEEHVYSHGTIIIITIFKFGKSSMNGPFLVANR